MKTTNVIRIFVIAVLFGMIASFSGFASSPAAVSARNIRQKFVQAFMNTDDQTAVPASGTVEVFFTLTDEGTVKIKKIKGTTDDLEKYVTEKITSVPCNDFVHPNNQVYKVEFNFDKD